MKRCTLLVLFLGLIASRTAMAQTICAGAEASSQACAAACSGQVVNDNVATDGNQGKFNVGNGNIGDGNDGFNNQGSFNIGSGNFGNCNLQSGGTVGSCTSTNPPGRIAVRFCNVYPTDPKCQPGGYLPEFSGDLISAIASTVGSCNGGPPAPPLPPVVVPPATSPSGTTVPPSTTPSGLPLPLDPNAAGQAPSSFIDVSDSKANPLTLLKLLKEHIKQEKEAGRKLLR